VNLMVVIFNNRTSRNRRATKRNNTTYWRNSSTRKNTTTLQNSAKKRTPTNLWKTFDQRFWNTSRTHPSTRSKRKPEVLRDIFDKLDFPSTVAPIILSFLGTEPEVYKVGTTVWLINLEKDADLNNEACIVNGRANEDWKLILRVKSSSEKVKASLSNISRMPPDDKAKLVQFKDNNFDNWNCTISFAKFPFTVTKVTLGGQFAKKGVKRNWRVAQVDGVNPCPQNWSKMKRILTTGLPCSILFAID